MSAPRKTRMIWLSVAALIVLWGCSYGFLHSFYSIASYSINPDSLPYPFTSISQERNAAAVIASTITILMGVIWIAVFPRAARSSWWVCATKAFFATLVLLVLYSISHFYIDAPVLFPSFFFGETNFLIITLMVAPSCACCMALLCLIGRYLTAATGSYSKPTL